MLKVSDVIEEIIHHHPSLQFGIHHRLLNLSQVARFIQPAVAARTQKEVSASAISMALSRLQRALQEASPAPLRAFRVDRIHIHTGLCSLTLVKTDQTHREISELLSQVQARQGYVTLTEGTREITTIIEQQHLDLAHRTLTSPPRSIHRRLAGLGVTFQEQYLETPGLLYRLLQQLALQNLNVVEVTSTRTEFVIYLNDADAMLAFDSLYHRFAREGNGR